MAYFALVTTLLAALAVVGAPGALLLALATVVPGSRIRLTDTLAGRVRHPLAWAWLVACMATAGSLYLSDVVGLMPCLFCWYQRIAMYPLVVILGVATVRGDASVWRYAMPVAGIGLLFSAYHVALQFQPALDVGACTTGVPCSARYLAIFGFVSIPVMAGAAFLLILACLLIVRLLDNAQE